MFERVYEGRKVLVTGHTGFKGSWLSEWLLELGAKVSGYSLYAPSEPYHFDVLKLHQRMTHIQGDINDYGNLSEVMRSIRPEIVFHLAAQPVVSTAIEDPILTFNTNLLGTVKVLEAIRHEPSVKAAVIITSDKCYENVEWEYGYRETDSLGGKDPYSASKACAEIAYSSYHRTYLKERAKDLWTASGRAGNVIGGGDWALNRIVPDCIRASSAKGKKAVIRSPHATRPWQHVLDPLSGYLWLGAKLYRREGEINGQSFNFGPNPLMNETVEGLLKAMQKRWAAVDWQVDSSALAGKEAGLLRLCCDKALKHLAWSPVLNFDQTVDLTTNWYQSYYEKGIDAAQSCTREDIYRYIELAKSQGKAWIKA